MIVLFTQVSGELGPGHAAAKAISLVLDE